MSEVVKVQKLLKLNADMLGKLKQVEQTLASDEAKKLEEAVPEGHPLKAEIEKQKAIVGGDLSGLPDGHPLIRALRTAKETYEVRKTEENTGAVPQEQPPLRKAKKLDEAAVRRERIAQEEKAVDDTNAASKVINGQLDVVLKNVRELWGILQGYEETFNKTPVGRVKLLRLKRILFATERGLSDTRIGRV